MTPISHVEAALARFLADPQPGVIAVKGDWGVGKTYIWQHFIARQKKVKGYAGYSYASLFGISSLEDLRLALFTNQASIGSPLRSADNFLRRGSAALVRYCKPAGLQNTELLAHVFEDKALRDIVICLDDLERKESTITTSALLGFITSLRDERRCKVVLLYNESKTKRLPEFSSAIAEYREKVIDHEVLLHPTVAECYALIFSDGHYGDLGPALQGATANAAGDARSLLQILEAAKVANIRLIRKVRQALDYFAPQIAHTYPKHWPLFARQIVKLCCLHFLHAQEFAVEEVADKTKWIAMFINMKKQGAEHDRHRAMYAVVDRIGYSATKIDQIVIDFFRAGFVEWDAYKAILEEMEADHRRTELAASSHATWDKLWDNFQAPADEVLAGLRSFLEANAGKLSLNEVAQLVMFLGEYSPRVSDKKILDEKIAAFVTSARNNNSLDFDLISMDPKVAAQVQKEIAKNVEAKPIMEVVNQMTAPGGWNPSDVRSLDGYTRDDFLTWLKSESSLGLLSKLAEFRTRLGGDAAGQGVLKRLDWALRKMEKRSRLDARRVHIGAKLPKPSRAKRTERSEQIIPAN
ncbi:MAG TPA: hypothetical protein VNW30_01095 [Opitutaceae bacterium]|jgi:hypothetical protein|nr:hypothetical protein [Opitutaceae bacterium]